jgi:outer membrane protein OmpA-like peptidoglycan-associated protein
MFRVAQVALGTLLAAGALSAQAAEAPYYNPANTASKDGYTSDYKLFKTIGCPGKGILEVPCKDPAPAQPAAAPKDADGDGVVDAQDKCPNTPAGAKVDAKGCELDSDGDGVVDRLDRCPNTPAGRKVNAQGCELDKDSDGDGVMDSQDKCPDTPAGAKVNAQGCELDSDGDGVVDRLDQCPDTPKGAKVDAKGCELDSDGDGVVDRLDQCPDTPKGRKVNAQGCEMDKDGDGIVDGLDQCPGTEPGKVVDNRGCPLAKVVTLTGDNFDNDAATLRADAIAILDDAVATLKRYPALKVEVAGHTDDRADDAYNQVLSERRAKAVMDYFVSKGVAADNLSAKGYGEAQPVADNGTAAGRAQNRRVELRILN